MVDLVNSCMTIYPAPVLAQTAGPVVQIDDNIRRFVDKMIDIMIENKGIGLAASQAGVPLRIFIISLDTTRENTMVYINPAINTHDGLDTFEEGCLSLPGITAKIKRYKKCIVTAVDIDGNEFTQEAEGLLARALQHEFDHLQGTLIANRMGQIARIAARKRLKELKKTYQQNKVT